MNNAHFIYSSNFNFHECLTAMQRPRRSGYLQMEIVRPVLTRFSVFRIATGTKQAFHYDNAGLNRRLHLGDDRQPKKEYVGLRGCEHSEMTWPVL